MEPIIKILKSIDRRFIFLITAIAVVLPLFKPIGFPIEPEKSVRSIYNKINAIPAGSTILMSFDYDPASKPECHPMAISNLRHAFKKGLKVVIVALWPFGLSMAAEAIQQVSYEFKNEFGRTLVNGVDYVIMGYRVGGAILIQQAGEDFKKTFEESVDGRRSEEIPILKNINRLSDFKLILSYSAGDPGIKQWIAIADAQYKVPVAGGVTAVTAPEIAPFLKSGQLLGLMSGLRGAADYEELVRRNYKNFEKYPNTATAGMESQNIVHIMIIIFIIIANIVYLYDKKKGLIK